MTSDILNSKNGHPSFNPLRTDKMKVSLFLYPTVFPKEFNFLKGPQASPVCPSGKSNTLMKMCVEICGNDTERAKLKYTKEKLSQCHFATTNYTQF